MCKLLSTLQIFINVLFTHFLKSMLNFFFCWRKTTKANLKSSSSWFLKQKNSWNQSKNLHERIDAASLRTRWRVDDENWCVRFCHRWYLFVICKNRWSITFDRFLLQKNDFRKTKLWNKWSKNARHCKNLQEMTTLHRRCQVFDTNDHWSCEF
jgi:hypothetical protein